MINAQNRIKMMVRNNKQPQRNRNRNATATATQPQRNQRT
jgi:hypothetical protein